MAFALIAATAVNGSSTTGSIDTTGANLIVFVVGADSVSNPTDNKGNPAASPIIGATGNFGGGVASYVMVAPTVGSGHTFTTGAGFPSMCVLAFSGADASPLDLVTSAGPKSAPYQAGSLTPTAPNCLVVAGVGGSNGSAHSIGGGYTLTHQNDSIGGTSYDSAAAYLIQTSATATDPVWSLSGGNSEGVILLSFFAAAASGTTWPGYQSPFGWN